MSGSHWASHDLHSYIEPDDTVEDIKEFLRIWNKSYSKNNVRPAGECLKETLAIEQARKEKLASEREQEQTVAPGQMQIDVETSECVGEETFVFNQEDEFEEIEQEFIQNEEETSEQADSYAEQEPTTTQDFEIYPTKKFVSTPARIRGAIKVFFDTYNSIKVFYDPLDNGGIKLLSEDVSKRLTEHLVANWNEIFKESGLGLEEGE